MRGRKKVFFKIILLGDAGTGKTTTLNRYTNSKLLAEEVTLGAGFVTKKINVDNRKALLQLWDTPGEEEFAELASTFYRNTDAYLLFYDVTKPQTLEHIPLWLKKLKQKSNPDQDNVFILVGNKTDLMDQRQVSERAVQAMLQHIKATFRLNELPPHKEISAKESAGVEGLFREATQALLTKPERDFYSDAKASSTESTKKKKPNTKKNRSIKAGVTTGILLTIAVIALASVFWPSLIALSVLHLALLAVAAVLFVVSGGLGASVMSDRCYECATAPKGSTHGVLVELGVNASSVQKNSDIELDKVSPPPLDDATSLSLQETMQVARTLTLRKS